MRQSILTGVLSFGIAACSMEAAFAQDTLAYVLEAFAAEEQARQKRSEIVFQSGSTETRYVIERVLPDKLHMLSNDGTVENELFVIGDTFYFREQGGWKSSPAIPRPEIALSVVELFKHRLHDLEEGEGVSEGAIEYRVFTGEISWVSGRSLNRGEIEITIEKPAHLPWRIAFTGRCGEIACAFVQTIEYDETLAIEAPVQ